MSKFTPGPWQVHKHHHAAGDQWLSVLHGAWDVTHNKDDGQIANCKYSAMSDEENLANAQLIAAAPELFSALSGAVDFALAGIGDFDQVMKACKAALSKAKGVQ